MKYKIIFLKKINKNLYNIGNVNLSSIKQIVNFKRKRYHINTKAPAYIKKNTFIYFIDIEDGNSYTFSEIKTKIDPEALDLLMGTHIIKQITSGLRETVKNNWFMLFLFFALGALLAGLIAMYYYTSKMDQLQQQLYNNTIWHPFSTLINLSKIWRGLI